MDYKNWIYAERKVVRYEHKNGGDTNEHFQGHGTRVAGVIAGSAGDEGDGIAIDAKIHIFDLKKEGGTYISNDSFVSSLRLNHSACLANKLLQ